MSKQRLDIIAAGHLCLDLIPRFDTAVASDRIADILRPGTLVNMGAMTIGTGGSVSNVGMAMRLFGCQVGFVAKVGDDALGRLIVEVMQRSGNTEGIRRTAGEASSYTVVVSPPGIDRIFLHCPGTNDTFTADDLDLDIIAQARLFHLGYPTLMRSLFVDDGRETARILEAAKETGVTTSLDISLPDPNSPAGKANWRRIYERALPYADIFLPSIEETFFTLHPREYLERKEEAEGRELIDFIGPEEYERFAAEYLSLGCKIAVIKGGHNGWYVRSSQAASLAGLGRALGESEPPASWLQSWAGRELWCPAFQVDQIASATGSGDSSIAGFLTALLRGREIEECLKLANAAGALNLRALDTLSGLGSWREVEEAAATLPQRRLSFLKEPWRRQEPSGVWKKQR